MTYDWQRAFRARPNWQGRPTPQRDTPEGNHGGMLLAMLSGCPGFRRHPRAGYPVKSAMPEA